MNKLIVVFAITLLGIKAHAQNTLKFDDDNEQYAVINDKDGFTNIRSFPSASAYIVGKIADHQVFICEPTKTEWWKVVYIAENAAQKEVWLEGYVNKNHIFLLKNWIDINGVTTNGTHVFKNKDLRFAVKTNKFMPHAHQLQFSRGNTNTHTGRELIKIDGKYFWGTDGGLPHEVISSVKLAIDNIPVNLPESAYNDLYEPNMSIISVSGNTKSLFYIKMQNSDGAGSYAVIWIFVNGKYAGRSIDDSED